MNLTLQPELVRLIEKQIAAGRFATPEDVVAAAVLMLEQADVFFGNIDPERMAGLLAEGEISIGREGTLDGEGAFQSRHKRRQALGSH